MQLKQSAALAAVAIVSAASASQATVVFQNSFNNGYFTPFNSANALTVKYGDSGWLSNFGSDTYTLTHISLGMANSGSSSGSGTLHFTFNDGDPSGLVFGPGTQLYATDIPVTFDPGTVFSSLEINLPNIITSGGFNNIGWSVSFTSFAYTGSVGFQCSTASGQSTGFYTSNASYYNGSSWSLFSFGPNTNTGVANFQATIDGFITGTPTPGAAGVFGIAGLTALRRRR